MRVIRTAFSFHELSPKNTFRFTLKFRAVGSSKSKEIRTSEGDGGEQVPVRNRLTKVTRHYSVWSHSASARVPKADHQSHLLPLKSAIAPELQRPAILGDGAHDIVGYPSWDVRIYFQGHLHV